MKFFSFIYQGEIHPATEDKVIPAEDFSTLMDVEEILRRAKEEVAQYKQDTEKECQELKEAARQEGFAEGLAQFNEHLLQFDKHLRHLRHQLQQQILPLALKAAQKIVGEQLALSPETIVEIVIQTLNPLIQNHHNRHFNIYVNKADKEILEAQKPKIKNLLEQLQVLTIQERSDVLPGGCIIETDSGIINASLENQWRALESAFAKYTQKTD